MLATFPAHCSLCFLSQLCQDTWVSLPGPPGRCDLESHCINRADFSPQEHPVLRQQLQRMWSGPRSSLPRMTLAGPSLLHTSGLFGANEGPSQHGLHCWSLGVEWPESTPSKTDLRWGQFWWGWRVLAEGLLTDLFLVNPASQMGPFPQDMALGKINGPESVTHHLGSPKENIAGLKMDTSANMSPVWAKPVMFQGGCVQTLRLAGHAQPAAYFHAAFKLRIIFMFLNGWKIKRMIFGDTWTFYEIHILVPISNILLEHSSFFHLHAVCDCFHVAAEEVNTCNRDHLAPKA